jgi:peroxiredoxin (alkyl hydroperoxide reductase subunit C)
MVAILQQAPDFKAPAVVPGSSEYPEIALSDFRGKWVVLFFYPLDFTFVCPTEIMEFSRRYGEFKELGAEILGVSCDSVYSHRAWLENALGELAYPLLSDYTKEMATAYGALLPAGHPTRATFIIDPEGIVQYASFNNPNVGRSVSEILRVLEAVQTGRLTPVEWKTGESTLG